MKTFREFIIIAESVEDIFGTEEERKRVYERDEARKRRRAARTGVSPEVEAAENKRKAFERSGLSPEEARRRAYRNVNVQGNTTNVSSKDAGFGGQTKADPKATEAPPKQPKASTSPPSKPPTRNVPAPSAAPPTTPKGPGLRARLGKLAGPAATVAAGAMEYKARRDQGQSRARAGGGALASGAGWAKGASLGFRMTPGPLPVKVAGAAVGGLVGDTAASAAYDYAADKTRPVRQATAKATGFDKFQQKNALIKPGSGLSGIARAQQTVDTRGARQVSAKTGTYGAKQGSALSGIGGKTTTSKDTKGNAFMSTGAGSQRKTVQLAKTQLVRDPKTGKQVVGDLAFKGGKATYLARPSVQSRDTSLSARVGRALNIGRYSREAEAQAAKQEYRTALKNTQTYQKKLGVTPKAATAQKLPGQGVGPKKVGPKIVGPKLVGPKK